MRILHELPNTPRMQHRGLPDQESSHTHTHTHAHTIEMYEGPHASHVARISSGYRSLGMLLAFRFQNK
jgi:hypothetical protein